VQVRILGVLEVLEGGEARALGGAKQRGVLAILVLHRGEVLSSERLIDELWGGRAPATAGKMVQGYVSHLRKALGRGVLHTEGRGYRLALAPGQLDLDEFERLAAEGRGALSDGDPATAADRLRRALDLWRGPPLPDFAYEPFAQAEIARLEEARIACLEDRIEADLALGRHAEVVGALEALIAEHPYRERLRAQLMLALYRCDRQADALQVYRTARSQLIDELGIEPGERLRELEGAILAQAPSLDCTPVATRPEWAVESGELRARAGGPTEGSFVGRKRELAELLDGVNGALQRRPALFLIAGEPGIGKSRLADEVTALAEVQGVRVLWGRCWEAGGAPAYWPWAQALRTYIRDREREQVRRELGAGAPDIAQMLPELHEMFTDLPAAPSLDPDGARFRLFDSTAALLRTASEAQPLMLVLDDLHAADTPSLLLLRFLARELGQARIVLVSAYRDTERDPDDALGVTVAELRREPIARLIRLGGLTLPEVAHCIELIVGAPPSEEVAVAIHRETEGNPLFVNELVRLLAAEGRLEHAAREPWKASIPQGMREVIAHRLRRLSPDCRRLLSMASVLGREFRLDALQELTERSGDELLDLIDEALAARVVGELPASRSSLRFSHALIRDTLYGALGRRERLRLHRRAAKALEVVYGPEREPHLAELAHHLLEAAPGGDVDKAIEYASQAGGRATALLAYEEAARLYEMALDALALKATADDRRRCELLLALGDAQARGGEAASWKETFVQGAAVARRLNAPEQLARAALGYGGRFVWFRAGSDQRLIPLLESALEALPRRSPLRARLLARLAGALRDQPMAQRRTSLCREAVELARTLGDPATLAYALEGSYAALSWPKDTQAWLEMSRELTRLGDETGEVERSLFGHQHAWGAYMVRGDVQAADAELATITALAHRLRQPAQFWSLAVSQASRALFDGRFAEAERIAEGAIALRSRGQGALGGVDDTTFYYVAHLQRWALRRERGGLEEVRDSIERYVAEYPTLFIFRCVLTNLYSQLGDATSAQQELDRLGADDFAGLEVGTEWHLSANLLAEACAYLGDTRHAPRLYRALLPYGDYNVMAHPEFSLGSASRYLGLLASTMSHWQDAATHFEQALAMNTKMGTRPWLAHTQHDYAAMLQARDGPGDPETARRLIQEALASYRELGMHSWADPAPSSNTR
jgi:DNA-binding SARP family transcriptional activator/tetratricopeptide (TPR) repeat protein